MPAILRSLFGPPQPTPPMQIDTSDMSNLTDLELRARLEAISIQRRVIADDHATRVRPLLEQRERLLQEIARLEDSISMHGIQRQDAERACDRDVQAVQAELRQRVVEGAVVDAVDDVVDQHAVDVLLDQMLSGRLKRNDVVGGPPELTEATEIYDRLEVRLRSFARQAAQTLSATGRLPDLPDDLQGFSDDLRREICAKEGLRI